MVQATDGDFYGTARQAGQLLHHHSLWDGLQNHASGTFTNPLQLLLAKAEHALTENPPRWADPGLQWGAVRHDRLWRSFSKGTIFKMTPSGTLTTLYSFCPNRVAPTEQALRGVDPGRQWGPLRNNWLRWSLQPRHNIQDYAGGTLTTLYSFCSQSGCADGENPLGIRSGRKWRLLWDNGVRRNVRAIRAGTTNAEPSLGFRPAGTFTTLYSFCSQSRLRGRLQSFQWAGPGDNGDFYGAQPLAGTGANCASPRQLWHNLQNYSKRYSDNAL